MDGEIMQWTLRLTGGPFDGAVLATKSKMDLPGEILFRQARWQPYMDAVYVRNRDGPAELLTPESILHPTAYYRFAGSSEILQVIHCQARMVLNRTDEISRLQKRFARLQERWNRSRGALKAAVARRKKKRNASSR